MALKWPHPFVDGPDAEGQAGRATPVSQLDQSLPDRWKAAHVALSPD